MELYDWTIFSEPFVDGPERWYARHPHADICLAAPTLDDLVARIWAIELSDGKSMSFAR